jgi:hypothetical protein
MPQLKRPPEVSWNFHKPPDPFPQTPGANGVFLAPSGQGKTTTLISMLLGPYRNTFDQIHVFSPSVEIDSAWNPVREFAKHLEGSSSHHERDEPALKAILDQQRDKIKKLKDAKSTKPLPQVLTIIDDFADRADIMHSAGNVLTTLFIRGRHFGSSCWLSSQKLTAISTVARVNFRFLLVWRLRNQKEIQALLEELSAIYPVKVLQQMYEEAINDEPYSFWFINLVAHKDDMFYVRFEDKMLLG